MRFRQLVWIPAFLAASLAATSSAATLPPAANAGIQWLQTQLQADGSLSNESLSIASPLQARSETATALGLAGQIPASLTGAVAADTGTDTESLSRHVIALVQGGQDPTAAVQALYANQNADGGFGDLPGYQSTSFDTSYALLALGTAGQGNSDAAHNAAFFLLNHKASDGSWSDWIGIDTAYSTALALQALAPYRGQVSSIGAAVLAGNSYLKSVRRMGSDWGESFIDAQAILALASDGGDPALVSGAADDLAAAQSADGSWGDDAFVTSLALRAMVASQGSALPTQAIGSAQGYVVEAGTGRAIAGATLHIASDSRFTATTNGAGYYTLANLPTGALTFVASAPGYSGASIAASVSMNGTTQVPRLVLAQDSGTGMVYGRITSQADGTAVAGASIQLTGAAPYTITAGADGTFALPSVAPGTYTLAISAVGYVSVSGNLDVAAGGQVQIDQSMPLAGTYPSDAPITVTATLTDAVSGAALAGATFTLVPGVTSAAADGTVSISGIMPGAYQALVSAPGHVAGTYSVILLPGSNGNLGMLSLYPVTADVAASTLTILGKVVNGLGNQPIANATITRVDTGETWSSAADGSFTISGLSELSVTLEVAATGYATQQFTLSASGYGTFAQLFVLPAAGSGGTASSVQLSGTVTDSVSGAVIPSATIELAGGTQQFVTGSDGSYQLSNIQSLSFSLQVWAPGYVTQTVPVSVSQFGNYSFAIQLVPAPPASTLQVLSVDARTSTLSATDTGVLTATVANTGAGDVDATLVAEITDATGDLIATVDGKLPGASSPASTFTVPAAGQMQAEFDWAPKQLPPGSYTVTVYAATPATATKDNPHGDVLATGDTSISVTLSQDFTGQVAMDPPLSQAGSQVPVSISALVVNDGNVTLDALPLTLTVTDPATGNVLYTAAAQASGLAVNNNVTLSFGSWLPTTTGNLKLHVAATDGVTGGTIDGTLYVGNKATASLTVDRKMVAPGNNTLHAKVAVQGVDLTQAISVDPLFFAVQRAVSNGGAYVATNTQAWQKTHQCLGCHIQTEGLVGLAGATGKATLDPNALRFLANAIGTSQQNDNTYHQSYPMYSQTQTVLGLWAIGSVQDHGFFLRSKLAAASYLHSKRVVSGNTVHWNLDYTPTWFERLDVFTALNIKSFADLLEAASGVDLSTLNSYAWGTALAPSPSVSQAKDVDVGPDGKLYAIQQNGIVAWVDPASSTHGTITLTGLPSGTADGIAVAPDGSFYVSGVSSSQGYVVHAVTGQPVTILGRVTGELTDVALSPSGILYALDTSTSQLFRFDGSTPTEVLGATTLKNPVGMAFDPDGNLMIADAGNFDLVEVAAGGAVSTWTFGLDQPPQRIASDGQGGWYVRVNTSAPLGYSNPMGLYHFGADGLGERLVDTVNFDGITLRNGTLIGVDRGHNTLVPLITTPIDPTLPDALRQDVTGAAQYLLGNTDTSNRLNDAERLMGLAEARRVVTDPTLLAAINARVASLDAVLRSVQRPDGGWGQVGSNASDALVTAWVGIALDYSNPSVDDPATRKAVQFLLNTQGGDGSWKSADSILATNLGVTGLVMDYLPAALDRLGGIDTDVFIKDVPGKSALANLNPMDTSVTIGNDGSSTYDWHMTGVTTERDVGFDVNLPGMLANESRPLAGAAYLQFKNSFTGELLTFDLDIPVIQAVSGLGISVGTDRPQYPAATPVLITGAVGNNGLPTANAQVRLEITAADGTVVADLPAITGLAVTTGGEYDYSAGWNTAQYLPGTYSVRAVIVDDAGTAANSATTSFSIAASSGGISGGAAASLRTSTDRIVYNTTDTAAIADLVQSLADNQILSLVHLHVTVAGPSGQTVGSYDHDLGQLLPGAVQDLPDTLALRSATQGAYTVTAILTDSTGTTLATGTATFSVVENLARTLVGQVSVQSPSVYQGNPETCIDTIIDNGTLPVADVPAQALVIDLASDAAIATQPSTVSLAAQQQQRSTQTVDTAPLAVGDYACVLQAQVNGAWSTLGYATFHVTDPTAALAGSLTATPAAVPLTTAVTLAGNVSNGGDAAISGITATISITDPAGDTVFTSPVDIASLAPGQGNSLLAGWIASGNVGDVDTATLAVVVGPKSRVLAQAQFTILPPPVSMTASLGLGQHGRVLILTDAPGRGEPNGPSGAPGITAQNQHLASVLAAAGWSYRIVTTADDFETQFNTGGYDVYVVLSESVKLPTQFQLQLDQEVNNGAGLVVAGNHDDRNNKLEEALGIHSTGKSLSVTGLSLDASGLVPAGGQAAFPLDPSPESVNKASASVVGEFQVSRGSAAPAVFSNDYGKGKAVYVAFDLAMEEAAAGSGNLFDTLFLGALGYVHPATLTPYQGTVMPFVLTVTNTGVATPGQATVTLPAGMSVVDPQTGMVSGNSITWTFNLTQGQVLTLPFWAALPAQAGSVTLTAVVQSGASPDLTVQATPSLVVGVQSGGGSVCKKLVTYRHESAPATKHDNGADKDQH